MGAVLSALPPELISCLQPNEATAYTDLTVNETTPYSENSNINTIHAKKLYNQEGTTRDINPEKSWIAYYTKYNPNSSLMCSFKNCKRTKNSNGMRLDGAHVTHLVNHVEFNSDDLSHTYIVPMCNQHNYPGSPQYRAIFYFKDCMAVRRSDNRVVMIKQS